MDTHTPKKAQAPAPNGPPPPLPGAPMAADEGFLVGRGALAHAVGIGGGGDVAVRREDLLLGQSGRFPERGVGGQGEEKEASLAERDFQAVMRGDATRRIPLAAFSAVRLRLGSSSRVSRM